MFDILQTSENGCFKKTKHSKFSEKNKHLLTPDTHTQGVKNVRFFRKLGLLSFIKTLYFLLFFWNDIFMNFSQGLLFQISTKFVKSDPLKLLIIKK